MNPILKKLGLKDQDPVLILNAPEEYEEIMAGIEARIDTAIAGSYSFIQVFATQLDVAKNLARAVVDALTGDGHLWLCYPKGTSKKYKSDINRTKAWEVFAPYEFEPVTQVAIDDDWSAMRFRRVEHIPTMKRKTAATATGQARIDAENPRRDKIC